MTRPAVFFDRDGTLVEEVLYLHDPERLVPLPGMGELALLAGEGVRPDAVLYCPHHPEGTVARYARACRDRKPGPGMLEAAGRRLGLDLAAAVEGVLSGNEEARPVPAVTERAWPGMPVGRERARPDRHLQRPGRTPPGSPDLPGPSAVS